MKTAVDISWRVGLFLLLVGLPIWGVWWLVSNTKPIHIPQCVKWEDHYYWVSWAGSRFDVGSNLEEARVLAGEKALTTSPKCVEYN